MDLLKTLSVLRWISVMLISLLGWITTKFMFPIAYYLRDVDIVRNKLLWIYYDDEDGIYGTDWWREANNYVINSDVAWFDRFACAYQWCALRNPAWNLQSILKPKQGLKKYISLKGSHSKNGNYDISIFDMCVLKYVSKDYTYQDNKGEYLSLVHSIIGSMFVWYEIDKTLYWRYSYAKKGLFGLWYEIQLGTNDRRFTFRLKIKRVKIV